LTPGTNPGSEDAPGRFSLSLYIHHREYNAGMGALLLYLSLLLLRPLLGSLVNLPQ
jgi:hypothetical protein